MKKTGSVILLILTLMFIYMLYDYLTYRHNNAVSDAAFVKSDSIYTLSFKVGGKIKKTFYNEGEHIEKDAILALIDSNDFILQKEKLTHTINASKANLQALLHKKERIYKELGIKSDISSNSIGMSDEKLKALQFRIDAIQTQLNKLSKDKSRYYKLLKQNLISQADFEKIQTKFQSLNDKLNASRKELSYFSKSKENVKSNHKISKLEFLQIKELKFLIKAQKEQIKALEKHLLSIENKISYCTLKSPIKGVIAKKFVNDSRVISKGVPVYSVVDPQNKHIEVLLSEKKLKGISTGNSAIITTEAMDKKKLKGVVKSILPTSASTFSLVPRDIASGEFTKLDQRFIVRIELKEPKEILDKIFIGMGATVAIERK